MSSRLDYYFRQRVSEAELDLGFELLEQADRALASDIGLVGIVSGAVPTPHDPVADLTIDLTGPARAYDKLGQRIFVATAERVDLSKDSAGVPTAVTAAGEERWVGVFLRFDRRLADPRLDGTSREVFFRRDEAFQLVVRQGTSGLQPTRVPLEDDALLVCDVRLREGQTQVTAGDIDSSRRQAFVFAKSALVGVDPSTWSILRPSSPTAQAAFDAADEVLGRHSRGEALRHGAAQIDYAPKEFLRERTLGGAFDELLVAMVGRGGATRVGVAELQGSPNEIPAGTVRTALEALLLALNTHVTSSRAHPATGIVATPTGFVRSTNVQAQMAELVAGLSAPTGWGLLGTSGAAGSPVGLAPGTVASTVQALLDALNAHVGSGDHDARYPRRIFSGNATLERGERREVGLLSQTPTFVTTGHSEVDATGRPTGPLFYHGPYSIAVNVYVRKENDGSHLWIDNNTSKKLFFGINAFAF